jgi:hypothetical protein
MTLYLNLVQREKSCLIQIMMPDFVEEGNNFNVELKIHVLQIVT